MDIKSILNQFKILDKNKDGTIQASEVESLFIQKYFPHKIFSDKVRGTTDVGTNVVSLQGPSWHAAGMLSVMHKTAPDAEIVHYNVTDMNVDVQDEQFARQ